MTYENADEKKDEASIEGTLRNHKWLHNTENDT